MLIPENNTPDKDIVIFRHEHTWMSQEELKNIIKRPSKTRDWFSPSFYYCLPLTIGNLYGFTIHSAFSFNAIWDGTESPDGITFTFFESEIERQNKYPLMSSHFGSGIITFDLPFHLKTPKNVNLMTINPTNYVIPNITVMTGVIETDNLQRDFTLNLKIQEPNRIVHIQKGDPLTSVIPIPRYFQDGFELKVAEDVFNELDIIDELQTTNDTYFQRILFEQNKAGRSYRKGQNVYGRTFPDHQVNINYES